MMTEDRRSEESIVEPRAVRQHVLIQSACFSYIEIAEDLTIKTFLPAWLMGAQIQYAFLYRNEIVKRVRSFTTLEPIIYSPPRNNAH
jgi:hypothetical protein